jgi:hypothetical protein
MRHAALNVVAIALIGASVVTSTSWAQHAAAPEDAPEAPTFAPSPLDLGFEEAAAIERPKAPGIKGWFLWAQPATLECGVERRKGDAAEGQSHAVLTRGPGGEDTLASVTQVIDAKAYRGKKVIFSAMVRTEPADGSVSARLWLRSNRAGGQMGFFSDNPDHPIISATWTSAEMEATIDADAQTIMLGVLAAGPGTVMIDQVQFEIVGDAAPSAKDTQDATTP